MARYSIQAPDGNTYQIDGPDGASDDQVRAEVLRQYPNAGTPKAAAQPAKPKPNLLSDMGHAFSAGAKQGIANAADMVGSFIPGVNALERLTQGNPVSPNLLAHPTGSFFQRALNTFDPSSRYQPQTTAGQYAKTVGQFLPAAAAPGSAPARVVNVFAPAIASETAGQIAHRAGASPGVEAAARIGGGLVGGLAASARVSPKAPALTTDDLQTAKTDAYAAVDNSGITVKPQAMQRLASNIEGDLQSASMNPLRHPKTASMLDDIKAASQGPQSLTGLDQLRQVVRRDVANASDSAERFMGQRIIGQIDKFTEGLGAKDVTATGSVAPEEAAGLLQNARDLNTRFRKVEAVTDAMDDAQRVAGKSGSGGNIDNVTRQKMYRVLKSIPNLTDEESAALDRIIQGGQGQDLLRGIGKMSPTGSGLMAMLEILKGGKLGAGAAITGLAAKVASDKLTRAKVQQLVQLMANGGTKAKVQAAAIAAQPQLQTQNVFRLPPVAAMALATPALATQDQQ